MWGSGMVDIDKLETLAWGATSGPWTAMTSVGSNMDFVVAEDSDIASDVRPANAHYIAAANPTMMLQLIAMCRRLQWTTKTPTEPGWYWNRVAGKETLPMRLYYDSDGEFCYQVAGLPDDCWLVEDLADEVGCEWAGPVPEP